VRRVNAQTYFDIAKADRNAIVPHTTKGKPGIVGRLTEECPIRWLGR